MEQNTEIKFPQYFVSNGGGQYFKRINEQDVIIVCEYYFNPLIEKCSMRSHTFRKLIYKETTEKTFNDARERVSLLLNQL